MNEHREPSHPMSEVRRIRSPGGRRSEETLVKRETSCSGVDGKYGQRRNYITERKTTMYNSYEPLETKTIEDLMEKEFEDKPHLVDTLLPGVGVYILAGDPKSGKSWLALDLALHIASGKPMWEHEVFMTEVLYLALEDGEKRLQDRILRNGTGAPPGFYYATNALTVRGELIRQLSDEMKKHPGIGLVIIDTLAAVKGESIATASIYQDDYNIMRALHEFSTNNNITILVIHHTNKSKSPYPMNNISGSNGVTGGADGSFVLEKDKFEDEVAKLYCSCRDYEDHVLTLKFNKETCKWECLRDNSSYMDSLESDPDMRKVVEYIKETKEYRGSASELSQKLEIDKPGQILSGKLRRKRLDLERAGILFTRNRSRIGREITLIMLTPSDQVPNVEGGGDDA